MVERLHSVLDSRNAAAVFNATAMAAGGGRSTSTNSDIGDNWRSLIQDSNGNGNGAPTLELGGFGDDLSSRANQALRINTSVGNLGTGQGGRRQEDEDNLSATSSIASDISSDISGSVGASEGGRNSGSQEIWRGDISAVIGLQKRGLRGLMEGRRLRERGASVSTQQSQQRVGLGIASN